MNIVADRTPQTLFDKIWERHRVMGRDDGQSLLYVDLHLLEDGNTPAFEMLRQRGLNPRIPSRAFATPDHFVPTDSRDLATSPDPEKRKMVETLQSEAARTGIKCFGLTDPRQGILHVVGPEQGFSLPGMLIVCGDSHIGTHGAMGILTFGIGDTEVAHVLATQCLWQKKPKAMRIWIEEALDPSVSAKDLILAIIAKIGTDGARGHVVEYAGPGIASLSIEGRLTLCNMSTEAGARSGLIAPDEKTFAYLAGRPSAPKGGDWDAAMARWRTLHSDRDAKFDREVTLRGSDILPMVTWGTSPDDAVPITGSVPDPDRVEDTTRRDAMLQSLRYMDLAPGTPLVGVKIDRVFIGSCTNGRIEDLRSAAKVVGDRKVAAGVEAWVVPGSGTVRRQAEAEGLDRVFTEAGFQWRQAGCSMCLSANGDQAKPGQRCASTSNRNFVGRQGPGVRTHLMSPAMAAAAAVTGRLTDVRQLVAGA